MYSIQKIIENQTKFKKEIIVYYTKEYSESKRILNRINSQDAFIIKEKNKLKNRFKKIKLKNYIERLFFLNFNRNKVFYVWWDEDEKEAKIFKYDKR